MVNTTHPVDELAILAKTDESYLPELWEGVCRLIRVWAVRYLPADRSTAQYEIDDLIQSGYLAMLYAVKDYPENCEHKFTTYLWYHCRNAFRDVLGIRTGKREPSVLSMDAPLTSEDDFTLADTLEDVSASEDFIEAERRIFNEQLAEALSEALDTIPDRERAVLRERYYADRPLKDIGAEMGCSYDNVRQIENNGLRSMRRGRAYKILKGFDYRSEGLRGTGLTRFRDTLTSSTEAAVMRLMGFRV